MSISTEQWIIYAVMALICGAIAQMLTGRSTGGFLLTTAVALGGAFGGAYVARYFGAQEPLAVTLSGQTFVILWALVGAIAAAFAVAAYQRRSTRARAR